MKKANWVEVEGAGNNTVIDNGGYVIKIVDVEDNKEWGSLTIYFDVAEGDHAGLFADMGEDDKWRHRLRQSYEGWQERYFKGFLTALEESNPSFSIARWQQNCDEHDLVGLIVGAVITRYHRINGNGNPTFDYNAIFMSADRIRNGKYTVPEDKWSEEALEYEAERKAEESTGGNATSDPYGDSIPFSV